MQAKPEAPTTVAAYIAAAPPPARAALRRIRKIVREAAPEAEELISYRMPAFRLGRILLYVAAFKAHLGIYPPVRGDTRLARALAPYAGEKGNLRFPYDAPVPYDLIERLVRLRVKQERGHRGRSRARAGG